MPNVFVQETVYRKLKGMSKISGKSMSMVIAEGVEMVAGKESDPQKRALQTYLSIDFSGFPDNLKKSLKEQILAYVG